MFHRKTLFLLCLFTIALLAIFAACTTNHPTTETAKPVFHIPVVVQEPTKDTVEFIKAYTLRHVYFNYLGKYKFTDTLKLAENPERDTIFLNDEIIGYSHIRAGDTLNTDGFQIFVDYKTSIHKNQYKHMGYHESNYYFPIYIVNETSRAKLFIAKDRYMFGIQEAMDTTDSRGFKPIEYRGHDFCGNGYFGMIVRPGEFILGLIPKYEGNEKQSMKIRLRIGPQIYFSPEYSGTFNREQFILKRDKWGYLSLEDCNTNTIKSQFYGAIPKGYKERGVN
ncbi:hypothetical protein [Emticicia agri]|uniref:Lipoprotein n=1 Tax=Emticicia agri TaxID=2492393 RepID=A0A4V1ZCT7_9BACT|nr:hypothetical protein [Emticicia agri]RYU93800.1 hypothetical protein EWM59_19960 [Emticicia agri]